MSKTTTKTTTETSLHHTNLVAFLSALKPGDMPTEETAIAVLTFLKTQDPVAFKNPEAAEIYNTTNRMTMVSKQSLSTLEMLKKTYQTDARMYRKELEARGVHQDSEYISLAGKKKIAELEADLVARTQ